MSILDLLADIPEPHPALVAAMRPTARQMTEAAAVMGLFPDEQDRVFRPAVAA